MFYVFNYLSLFCTRNGSIFEAIAYISYGHIDCYVYADKWYNKVNKRLKAVNFSNYKNIKKIIPSKANNKN